MTKIEKKTGMTDSECEYWDKYYTENTFEPGPNMLKQGVKPGSLHNTPFPFNELSDDTYSAELEAQDSFFDRATQAELVSRAKDMDAGINCAFHELIDEAL